MIININPNRINPSPAGRSQISREQSNSGKAKASPKRVEENFIPEPESLASMIRNAIASLREGLHLDRGMILNLLV